MSSGTVVIDDGWLIVKEYRNKLSSGGQPGPGDAFLKWLLSNLANSRRCRRVKITPRTPSPSVPTEFEEFPVHPALEKFDEDDRKFVAVARADRRRPLILQGLDTDWWGWRLALRDCGVEVEFVCEQEIEELWKQRSGRRAKPP